MEILQNTKKKPYSGFPVVNPQLQQKPTFTFAEYGLESMLKVWRKKAGQIMWGIVRYFVEQKGRSNIRFANFLKWHETIAN